MDRVEKCIECGERPPDRSCKGAFKDISRPERISCYGAGLLEYEHKVLCLPCYNNHHNDGTGYRPQPHRPKPVAWWRDPLE